MRLALCHFNVVHKEKGRNQAALIGEITEAAENGAKLIVTPELSLSGYGFDGPDDARDWAEGVPGEATQAISAVAREHGCYICLGLMETDDSKLYNIAVVVGPMGDIVTKHRKVTAEKSWATVGDRLSSSLFNTPWGNVGVLICSDSYYGILPRILAARGADMLIVPANWPPTGGLDPREIWRTRALENGLFVAACNRTGVDLRLDCRESTSEIYSPDGASIASLSAADSQILYSDLPPAPRPETTALFSSSRSLKSEYSPFEKGGRGDIESTSTTHFTTPNGNDSSTIEVVFDGPSIRLVSSAEPEPFIATVGVTVGDNGDTPVFSRFGGARIAIVSKVHLTSPEVPFALSEKGVDILLAAEETMTDAEMDAALIRAVERLAVAVVTPRRAALALPPKGHERWREWRWPAPVSRSRTIDLAQTRDKGWLRRIEFRKLLDERGFGT